jgi:hypothetical protein
VTYFLLTFTVPDTLHAWFKRDEAFWYDALFTTSSRVLMALTRERQPLQGEGAFLSVLHTWTRDLRYHPHLHVIMPGGVLRTAEDGRMSWGAARQHQGRDYLFAVRHLSVRMRMEMEQQVREQDAALFAQIPASVWRQEWVAHCQSAGDAKNTLRYLARYVTKSALGADRILSDDERGVRFTYTPQGERKARVMTLEPHAFIQRVLQHALPKGFKRVRYYGWLHPAAKARFIQVQGLLQAPIIIPRPAHRPSDPATAPATAKPVCQECGGSEFRVIGRLPAHRFIRLGAGREGSRTAPSQARAPPTAAASTP